MRITLGFFVGLFISTSFASEGLRVAYDMEMTHSKDKKTTGSANYMYQDGSIRAEMSFVGMPIGKVIYVGDGKTKKSYSLFPEDKSYMETTGLGEKFQKQGMQHKETEPFKETGETRKIAGYSCAVMARESTAAKESMCVSKDLYAEYASFIQSMAAVGDQKSILPQNLAAFPLEYASVSKGSTPSSHRMTVRSIEKKNNGPEMFMVPKDYKPKSLPGGQGNLSEAMKNAQGKGMTPEQMEQMKKMVEEMQKKYGQPEK